MAVRMALEDLGSAEFLEHLREIVEDLGVEFNRDRSRAFVDALRWMERGLEARDYRVGSVLGRNKRALGNVFTAIFVYLEIRLVGRPERK